MSSTLEELLPLLEELKLYSAKLEESDAGTAHQLNRMATTSVMRWGIPEEFGGRDLSAADQTKGFERLASACLVSTFVLSQRNAAVTRIVASDNDRLKEELLPRLAAHEIMATVGISHLTTSRQHLGRPAVIATPNADGYSLDGEVPWVTAAAISDFILTGGTLADGRQLLAMVPKSSSGISIDAPVPMLALNASQTGPVTLSGVKVSANRIVAGPTEKVMSQAGSGTGSVTTSALAVGAARGVLEHFAVEAERRPELLEILKPLVQERQSISSDIRRLLETNPDHLSPELSSESIRHRANSLALRASQAYLAASKGAGFVKGHPAERAVREAMFFLVWSCPRPVVDAALRQFACLSD